MITLTRDIVRLIQAELNMPKKEQDGLIGKKTDKAIKKYLVANKSKLHPAHADDILAGGRKRKAAAFGQLKAIERDISPGIVDGLIGPTTNVALEQLVFLIKNGRKPHLSRDHDIKAAKRWPVEGTQEFKDFYGRRGGNTVRFKSPYPLRIAWNTSQVVNSFSCHKQVVDSLDIIFAQVLDHYGLDQIRELGLDLFGGCLNVRKKRGGNTWSMHSWANAIDFNPAANRLKWHSDKAVFAKPEYDKWWDIWESEGWVGLGRVAGYDWMHIQAARTKGMS